MSKRLFHCLNETLDLDQLKIVTDVITKDAGADAIAYFIAIFKDKDSDRRYLLKGPDGVRTIQESHTALIAAWGGEDKPFDFEGD